MLKSIKNIIKTNKEFILLLIFILVIFIIINSSFFFPIITSIVLSYLLHKIKKILILLKCPVNLSFLITYSLFISFFLLLSIMIFPVIVNQITEVTDDAPFIIQKIDILINKFIKTYPSTLSSEQNNSFFSILFTSIQIVGKIIISLAIWIIKTLTKLTIYAFTIPILVFFFLKDYIQIALWFKKIIPEQLSFLEKVWEESSQQINNYVKGKVIEILIVALANYILFKIYGLAYPIFLGFCVGLSVVIPYVGTIIISIPITIISALQLGLTQDCLNLNIIYAIIQFLDGNILVPILFSKAVKLHPLSIIFAVIIFGSTLNIYGLFFAIPFAIITNTIIKLYFTSEK